MNFETESHAPDEWLERYSMRRLTEEESESLEDHLMFCQWCQNKLVAIESYLFVARHASRQVRLASLNAQASPSFWSRFSQFSLLALSSGDRRQGWLALPITAAAMACLALLLVVPQSQDAGYQQVRLEAARANISGSVSSKQPLELVLNLDGLPSSKSYRVEIVNAEGASKAVATGEPQKNAVTVRVKSKLPPGQYWVRLYIPGSNDLLREFSLRSN